MSGEAPPRFVLDTNVTVSAVAFPQSKPREAFDLARRVGILLASAETFEELVRTLRRPKLAPYITPPEREVCNDNLHDRWTTMRMAGLRRQWRRKM